MQNHGDTLTEMEEQLQETSVGDEDEIFQDSVEAGDKMATDSIMKNKAIEFKSIYFDFKKWDIRSDAIEELDKIVATLNANPEMEMELISHTDCIGSVGYNNKLSEKRAKATAEYIGKGISNPDRISAKGYGELRPAINCNCDSTNITSCTGEQHQLNRRTEFKIIKK